MLRITVCKSASAAQSYYTQGLAGQDYYSEGQEIIGTWHGRGAEMLNLPKLVNEADFAALTENRSSPEEPGAHDPAEGQSPGRV